MELPGRRLVETLRQAFAWSKLFPPKRPTGFASFVLLLVASRVAFAAACPPPLRLGQSPTRLVVVVPATGQGPGQWKSFLSALKKEPESKDLAWLLIDHGVRLTSPGTAFGVATEIDSCIQEKVRANAYKSVTLIGHSIGGMLARRAYLEAAGAFPDHRAPPESWANKVDRILLFASVNRGVQPTRTPWRWGVPANWLLRTLPHPHLVFEDIVVGSDFIADVRIAWIRHFGELYGQSDNSSGIGPPHVVQFWGTRDSLVTESDNADLEAFSGPVIERVTGAQHGNLNRLEAAFTDDPESRWALFRKHIFEAGPLAIPPAKLPRRVLFIVRGIRDSSGSDWVRDLRRRALKAYDAVEDPDYGYFTAAHFALRPLRAKNIPMFRDLYAQCLAENPRTTFDFIGHSNGTYILGYSLLSTPSMHFRNVVLVAPVLPTEFDWNRLFLRGQVVNVRYDAASWDWPVGILCPLLRAVGFRDVGPSGVVLFGEGTMVGARLGKVSWYDGGHSAALRVDRQKGIDNRQHLLDFALNGSDLAAGEDMKSPPVVMQLISRAVPYAVWIALAGCLARVIHLYRKGQRVTKRGVVVALLAVLAIYAVLDIS
jgi:hypothetical protein